MEEVPDTDYDINPNIHRASLCDCPFLRVEEQTRRREPEGKRQFGVGTLSSNGVWHLGPTMFPGPHECLLIPTFVAGTVPRTFHVITPL